MSYIRREMDFGDFMGHIGVGLLIAAIVMAICLFGLGSGFFAADRGNNMDEQNLYLALRGQVVEDEKAMATAEIVQQVYKKGSFSLELKNPTDLERLKKVGLNEKTPYERNSLPFAMENWDKIAGFLGDPSADIPVALPLWKDWFLLATYISLMGLALGASGSYIYYTLDNYRRDNDNKWWQYPWNKAWAYPMILVVAPYVATVQPIVLICAIVRRLKYGVEEIPSRVHKPEPITNLQKRNLEEKIWEINGNRDRHRQNWIEACGWRLVQEKDRIENEIQSRHSRLSDLGKEIELNQRNLAKSKNELNILSEAIAARKADQEYGLEFDQIAASPHVRAVEIVHGQIRVYTDTVFLRSAGVKREIGNFLIRIEGRNLSIENITNTNLRGKDHPHGSGGSFCFGSMNGEIDNLLKKKNYLPLIGLIIQALYSYNPLGAVTSINEWKIAKNQL